jgi:outer membrane protein OmpA-like peptidoglycan-associated protein
MPVLLALLALLQNPWDIAKGAAGKATTQKLEQQINQRLLSGHTDSSGNAAHNKDLSQKRAQVIVKELVARGVPDKEIVAVGKGSEAPLVKPDDTPAKKARNRRYEVRVRL